MRSILILGLVLSALVAPPALARYVDDVASPPPGRLAVSSVVPLLRPMEPGDVVVATRVAVLVEAPLLVPDDGTAANQATGRVGVPVLAPFLARD